jgi:hypothetical protein
MMVTEPKKAAERNYPLILLPISKVNPYGMRLHIEHFGWPRLLAPPRFQAERFDLVEIERDVDDRGFH